MAEHQLPKLNTRVRFPSSAPVGAHLTNVGCVLFLLAPAQSCFADSMPKAKIPPSSRMAGFRLSKKWFARKSCTKEATCMPTGSGHGFVQLVSCGLRAALFYDLLSAPGAEEQDFALCGRFDRRSYRGDTGRCPGPARSKPLDP